MVYLRPKIPYNHHINLYLITCPQFLQVSTALHLIDPTWIVTSQGIITGGLFKIKLLNTIKSRISPKFLTLTLLQVFISPYLDPKILFSKLIRPTASIMAASRHRDSGEVASLSNWILNIPPPFSQQVAM